MSVQTEADDCMDRAIRHIKQALEEMGKVVTTEIWGYSEFNDAYKEKVRDSFMELVTMRDRFK